MADIVMRNLVKTYPGTRAPATDDVSIEVADGEFLVLVGPSGCGKTTLLRMIAGLETPDSGEIRIRGRDVTDLPARQRNVSMVFQSYAIFPHLRVRQNIAFGLTVHKVPKADIDQRVAQAADLLNLTDYLDRYPAQLSGGQRQRVAVARAIVVNADVLLMDEPLSNLDALLRLQFRTELKKIVQELGATTVYVTHDQAEALSLGDRVAVMRAGRVVQLGPPIEVYDKPAEQFVGGFLGSPPMNFLPAVVRMDGEGAQLAVGEQRLTAPDFLAGYADQPVLIGVRAENIDVTPEAAGAVTAKVVVLEPTGAAVLITVQLDGHELKVQAPASFQTEPGKDIRLGFHPDRMRLYDPQSALALATA
ncbi:MAG: multiple sugar transport system ATP-binding protein [Mycobacteriales bacterium]